MTQIVALLISVVQLYMAASNPNLPASIRDSARGFAEQAFALAQTELASLPPDIVPSPAASSAEQLTPSVQSLQSMVIAAPQGAPPAIGGEAEQITPSCTLTGTYIGGLGSRVDLEWTTTGIDSSVIGKRYVRGKDLGRGSWEYNGKDQTEISLSHDAPLDSVYKIGFDVPNYGRVYCFAFYPKMYHPDPGSEDVFPIHLGDVTTSTNPYQNPTDSFLQP